MRHSWRDSGEKLLHSLTPPLSATPPLPFDDPLFIGSGAFALDDLDRLRSLRPATVTQAHAIGLSPTAISRETSTGCSRESNSSHQRLVPERGADRHKAMMQSTEGAR